MKIDARIKEIWKNLDVKVQNEKGELKRVKLLAKLSRGETLDIGYEHKPNPFLNNCFGIDIEKINKPKNYCDVFQVNVEKEKFPFKDQFFDTIIAAETIEHLQNLDNLMNEVNRVLKPKGRLIISFPNPTNVNFVIMDWLKLSDVKEVEKIGKGHVHSFLFSDMNVLFEKNGFKLKKVYGTYFKIPFTRIQLSVNWPRFTFQRIYVGEKVN